MEVSRMKAPDLKRWVIKLNYLIERTTDGHNLKLYNQWLKEAEIEKDWRRAIQEFYLKEKEKNERNNKTRSI